MGLNRLASGAAAAVETRLKQMQTVSVRVKLRSIHHVCVCLGIGIVLTERLADLLVSQGQVADNLQQRSTEDRETARHRLDAMRHTCFP